MLDQDFVALLEKLHGVELHAEREGFNRAADFLHETRAILREHMDGFYTKRGPVEYNLPGGSPLCGSTDKRPAH